MHKYHQTCSLIMALSADKRQECSNQIGAMIKKARSCSVLSLLLRLNAVTLQSLVEHTGFEPVTSTLPVLRAPNCANAPWTNGDGIAVPSVYGGGRWIRTIEVSDNRFTVCPLWPLGNSPQYAEPRKGSWSWWTESNHQPADYKSAALPLSHTSILWP